MDGNADTQADHYVKYFQKYKSVDKRRNGRRTSSTFIGTTHVGAEYDEEQKAWLKAVQDFLHAHRRYPTLPEAFALAHALGYRKCEISDDEVLPPPSPIERKNGRNGQVGVPKRHKKRKKSWWQGLNNV